MSKKTSVILGSIVLGVAVLSLSTVMLFRHWNAPTAVEAATAEFSIPETTVKENNEPISVAPIVPQPKKEVVVIEEPTVSKPEDSVPPPEVSETTEPDGGVVQTPNWEAQKELAPDTDLKNPEKEPEYVKPPQSQASSKPAAPASSSSKEPAASSKSGSTPKNGDTKTENGKAYTYVKGFGWVQDGNGNVDIPANTGELSGNKVGH